MSIRLDNSAQTTSLTSNFTVGSDTHRYLIVQVNLGPNTTQATSITYAGVPLTLLVRDNTIHSCAFWGLAEPASGTNQLVITLNGGFAGDAFAISFGADSPISVPVTAHTSNTSAAPAISLTGQIGDLLVGGVCAASDATLTFGETELVNDEAGDATAALTSTGVSQTISWSLQSAGAWDTIGIALRSVASSSVFGTLAGDLVSVLSAAMPGYDWVSGEAPDVSGAPGPSAAIGFVWVDGSERDSHDHLIMETTAYVRVYPVQADQDDPQTPIDPAPLYQAVDDLQNALKAHQAPADAGAWFFEVTKVKLTHTPGQWFDATVVATGPNTFALS